MSESWGAVLDRGAAKLAARIVSDIERVVRSTDPIDVEIVSLTLVYVQDSGSLAGEASLNPSRDADDFASGRGGWWPIDEIEYDVEPALEAQLLGDAALHSVDDPVRTVLNATAAVLARHTWSALFPVSDDFVAFIAEHDEGIQEKSSPSVRAIRQSARSRGSSCCSRQNRPSDAAPAEVVLLDEIGTLVDPPLSRRRSPEVPRRSA